jgi:RHS repeat-associated protein
MEEYGNAADSAGGTGFLTKDHLGSTRLVTDAAGGAKSCVDYLPFGEELGSWNGRTAACYAGNAGRVKFTGKERDGETGLDYFGARYLSAAQGRFTSPDEFPGGIVDPFTGQQVGQAGPLPYADIGDPQTLNKYGYVRNNPLRFTDPDGHCGPWCAFIGAGAGAAAQAIADLATGQPLTFRKEVAAALNGAIVGGSGGLAAELGIAVQVAIVGSSGVVGGIAERAINTGSMSRAMQNPTEFAVDFASNAVGHGLVRAAESVVTKTAGGAVETLSRQAERAQTSTRQAKVETRLSKAASALESKKQATAATTDTAREAVVRQQQQKRSCNGTLGCQY